MRKEIHVNKRFLFLIGAYGSPAGTGGVVLSDEKESEPSLQQPLRVQASERSTEESGSSQKQ